MGISYQITFAGGPVLNDTILSILNPLLLKTVQSTAQDAVADWQTAVNKAKLPPKEKKAYVNSISWRETGEFSVRVESDYKLASEIETGRPAKDLKVMLDTSRKVRRTEDGRRFLVIPMRHNTPGNTAHAAAMPSSVYDLVKTMKPTRVLKKGSRQSGEVVSLVPGYGMSKGRPNANYLSNPKTQQASMVASRQYAWGGKLTKTAMKNAGIDKATAKNYAGMVKMDTGSRGSKSSAYMTFRIMMEGQTGKWIIPAAPGLFLAKKVADDLQPKATESFKQAVKWATGN